MTIEFAFLIFKECMWQESKKPVVKSTDVMCPIPAKKQQILGYFEKRQMSPVTVIGN